MRGLIAVWLGLALAWAHPSATAEGAKGELRFSTDLEIGAQMPLRAWFELQALDANPISIADCVCTVLLYRGQALASTPPLWTLALEGLEFELSFPEAGAYTLVLLGKPRPGTKLQAFKLTYPVVVLPTQ